MTRIKMVTLYLDTGLVARLTESDNTSFLGRGRESGFIARSTQRGLGYRLVIDLPNREMSRRDRPIVREIGGEVLATNRCAKKEVPDSKLSKNTYTSRILYSFSSFTYCPYEPSFHLLYKCCWDRGLDSRMRVNCQPEIWIPEKSSYTYT